MMLKIKNCFQELLKSSGIGRAIYPFCKKCWRAYAIPQRRRRLQKSGPAALGCLHGLMVENGVPYYCDYGTLIGLMREGGFLKHDDDIDISVQPDAIEPKKLLQIFLTAGYGFVHGFEYEGRLTEFTITDISGIFIDVFFPMRLDDDKINGYQSIWESGKVYPSEYANTIIQYDFIAAKDIKAINVLGVEANVPGNFDDVLTSEYGPWRVPDAKFDTVKDRIHRELPGFSTRFVSI